MLQSVHVHSMVSRLGHTHLLIFHVLTFYVKRSHLGSIEDGVLVEAIVRGYHVYKTSGLLLLARIPACCSGENLA